MGFEFKWSNNSQKVERLILVNKKDKITGYKEMVSQKISSILDKFTKLVDPVIEELLNSYVDKKNREIVKYQIFTGGKRLRPALVLITCQLLGGKIKDALFPATGLEILHNYSLIIDDIMEQYFKKNC